MTFKIKRTAGQGIEFEISSRPKYQNSLGSFWWPARVYRIIARDMINGLLEENRALRHNRMVVFSPRPKPRYQLYGTILNRLAPRDD